MSDSEGRGAVASGRGVRPRRFADLAIQGSRRSGPPPERSSHSVGGAGGAWNDGRRGHERDPERRAPAGDVARRRLPTRPSTCGYASASGCANACGTGNASGTSGRDPSWSARPPRTMENLRSAWLAPVWLACAPSARQPAFRKGRATAAKSERDWNYVVVIKSFFRLVRTARACRAIDRDPSRSREQSRASAMEARAFPHGLLVL